MTWIEEFKTAIGCVMSEKEMPKKELSPAAKRALAEAEERRTQQKREQERLAKEKGGREGPEPTRYGDWEKKGIAVDF